MPYLGKSREELRKETLGSLKSTAETEAWASIVQYFFQKGNGPEAKIACVVIATLAREKQAENNSRQLDIIEKRILSQQRPAQISAA